MIALARDGRRSAVNLATEIGVSAPTVRRRLDRLIGEQLLSLRCEVAHVLNGWHVTATLWARSPGAAVNNFGRALADQPEVRVCCAITGESNLVVTAWLHGIADLHVFERRLAAQFPALEVTGREVTLHTPKRLGMLLDSQGRRTGMVPIGAAGASTNESFGAGMKIKRCFHD